MSLKPGPSSSVAKQQEIGQNQSVSFTCRHLIQSDAIADAEMMPQFSLWLTLSAVVRPLRMSSGVANGRPSGPYMPLLLAGVDGR